MNVATFEEYRRSGQESAETLLESIPVLEQQGEDAMDVVIRGTGGKVEPRVEVPALEAPSAAPPDERESPQMLGADPETAEPRPSTEGRQEPPEAFGSRGSGTARGSLWRRIFGR